MYDGREQWTRPLVPRSLFPGELVHVQAGGAENFQVGPSQWLGICCWLCGRVVFGVIRVGELWWTDRAENGTEGLLKLREGNVEVGSYVCVYPTACAGWILGRQWECKMREKRIRSDGQVGWGGESIFVWGIHISNVLDFQVQSHWGMRLESQRESKCERAEVQLPCAAGITVQLGALI